MEVGSSASKIAPSDSSPISPNNSHIIYIYICSLSFAPYRVEEADSIYKGVCNFGDVNGNMTGETYCDCQEGITQKCGLNMDALRCTISGKAKTGVDVTHNLINSAAEPMGCRVPLADEDKFQHDPNANLVSPVS